MESFISTGCTLLDECLGGGFALRRMGHIVGDPSTNKTGIAIELAANFFKKFPKGKLTYCDAEAAFDVDYAEKLGMPIEQVEFLQPVDESVGITVEGFAKGLGDFLDSIPADQPGLFILDSLDSLPTMEEATTDFDKRSRGYGTAKAKALGEIFRSSVQKIANKEVCLLVISQTRDNVEGYGPKKIFSGGQAVKFYVSQRVMLHRKEFLKKTIDGADEIYGVHVEAEVDKNKCAPPHRKCSFDIVFGYGMDDLTSNVKYMQAKKRFDLLPPEYTTVMDGKKEKMTEQVPVVVNRVRKLDKPERLKAEAAISKSTKDYWKSRQDQLFDALPKDKYEN